MRRHYALLGALLLAAQPTAAAELGSNANPLSFGKDQTIVDVSKVVWGPLEVEGLPKGGEIAVLRGDLGKGEAEALLRFPAGYKVPNHSHTSDELYMWLSGAFTLIAHDGTRTEFAGPTYISFPGSAPPHGLECGAGAPCVLYLKLSRPFDIQYFPEPPPKR
ncbi:cupin domain-containing protein [Hyphomicrobium sp.]|uniref:cupin domain-containing protein n=1 Tax=Hyphomicrobium sp. TaxID=82 RepID=UPI002FDFD786